MEKPVKQILFAAIVIAATASAAYVLNMLDQIVHGQLYNYHLEFSLEWANPYWNLLRIVQILLAVTAVAAGINAALSIREYFSGRLPSFKRVSASRTAAVSHSPTRQPPMPTRTVRQTTPPVDRTFTKPSIPQPEPEHDLTMTQTPTPTPAPASQTTIAHSSIPASARTPKPSYTPYSEPAGTIRCSHCGKAFTQPLRMLDFQGDRPRIVNICPFCNEIVTSTPAHTEAEQEKRFQPKSRNNNHGSRNVIPQ